MIEYAMLVNMKQFFASKDIDNNSKIRMLQCNSQSYSTELKHPRSEEIWKRIDNERKVAMAVKARKLVYLCHISRGNPIPTTAANLQEKIVDKRRKMPWLKNLGESFKNKAKLYMMIAKLPTMDANISLFDLIIFKIILMWKKCRDAKSSISNNTYHCDCYLPHPRYASKRTTRGLKSFFYGIHKLQ